MRVRRSPAQPATVDRYTVATEPRKKPGICLNYPGEPLDGASVLRLEGETDDGGIMVEMAEDRGILRTGDVIVVRPGELR